MLTVFPPVPFFGDVSSHDECDEGIALRHELPGKSWLEIPSDFIDFHSGSLPLMTPDGLHAFLPAWLLRSMERLYENNCVLSEFTLYFLCPGSWDDEGARWEETEIPGHIALFDDAQRSAIRDYLNSIIAETSLESWHPYAACGLKCWS